MAEQNQKNRWISIGVSAFCGILIGLVLTFYGFREKHKNAMQTLETRWNVQTEESKKKILELSTERERLLKEKSVLSKVNEKLSEKNKSLELKLEQQEQAILEKAEEFQSLQATLSTLDKNIHTQYGHVVEKQMQLDALKSRCDRQGFLRDSSCESATTTTETLQGLTLQLQALQEQRESISDNIATLFYLGVP